MKKQLISKLKASFCFCTLLFKVEIIKEAVNLVKKALEDVFVKDDGVLRRKTLDEIERIGFEAFKKKYKF